MAGFGDLGKLMKDAQQMQQQLKEKQSQLAKMEVTTTSGGGMVTVVATGDQRIKSIQIDSEVIDPKDPEMLQDLIVAAVNDALSKSKEMAQQELSTIAGGLLGGMNLPGIFG